MVGVARLVALRLLGAVGTLIGVSAIMFVAVWALPGNAAQQLLGQEATPERVEALTRTFGLDRPVFVQYWDWLTGIPQGDFGTSITSQQPVAELLGDRVRNTATLALIAVVLLALVSITLGVITALGRDRWVDHLVSNVTLVLIALPEFVIGALLIVLLAFSVHVFPAVSVIDNDRPLWAQLNVVALPVLTLIAVAAAQATRMVRATVIDVLQTEYVQSAILRGLTIPRIVLFHVMPNALAPTLQILALTTGWLVGGVVVTEALFQFPGVGSLLTSSVSARDTPTVLACALVVSTAYICMNLLAEVGVILLNPRLRRKRAT